MNDLDIIIVDDGGVFEGTRQQFEENFFTNADDESIRAWCHANHYSLSINPCSPPIGTHSDDDEEENEETHNKQVDIVLDAPLSTAELRKIVDKDDWLEVTVKMELRDIVHSTPEEFLDRLSELVTGTNLMTDITYSLAGCYYELVLIRVCGIVTEIFERTKA